MSDISNIDPERLRATAKQLDEIRKRIDGCVNKFHDAIQNLDKGWVSEVKASFMDNVQKDMEATGEMLAQLLEVSMELLEAASDFDKTESDMLTSVNALK
jgi:WXG100 family type VII secretion target